jgi:hypothetical protein
MLSTRTRELIAESVRYCTWLGERVQDERIEILEHLSELSIEADNLKKMVTDLSQSITKTT